MTFKPTTPQDSRLTPLWQTDDQIANNGQRYEAWQCQCSCGKGCVVRLHRLESGTTKSCGCLRREMGKAKIEIARAAHVQQAQQRRERHATEQ